MNNTGHTARWGDGGVVFPDGQPLKASWKRWHWGRGSEEAVAGDNVGGQQGWISWGLGGP